MLYSFRNGFSFHNMKAQYFFADISYYANERQHAKEAKDVTRQQRAVIRPNELVKRKQNWAEVHLCMPCSTC